MATTLLFLENDTWGITVLIFQCNTDLTPFMGCRIRMISGQSTHGNRITDTSNIIKSWPLLHVIEGDTQLDTISSLAEQAHLDNFTNGACCIIY